MNCKRSFVTEIVLQIHEAVSQADKKDYKKILCVETKIDL